MTRHLRPPASPPALERALGSAPVTLTVAGQLVPLDEHGSVSIRRRKGVREPLGDPATCSVLVNVDTPPSWRKGDRVVVEAGSSALTAVFGSEYLASNYTPNPGFEVNTTGYTVVSGRGAISRQTTAPRYGVANGRFTFSVAVAAGLDLMYAGAAAPEAVAGSRWTGRISLKAVSGGSLYRVELRAMNGVTSLAAIARADVSPSAAWAEFTVPSIAVCPANTTGLRWYISTRDEYTAGSVLELDGLVCHDSSTPPTEYVDGSLAPFVDGLGRAVSYRWDGTAHLSNSRKLVTGTPEKWAAARYRFVGRLSDLKLRTGRTAPATAQLVAVGTTEAAARTTVGDSPWTAEVVTTRAARILGFVNASNPAVPVTTLTVTTGPTIGRRDVDAQPAASLLEDLAPMIGPRAGLVERRSGELVFGDIADGTFDPLDLPSGVVEQGLDHDAAPRVNDVTVDLGAPDEGTIIHTNEIPNPGFEVNITSWSASAGSAVARDTVNTYSGAGSGKVTPTAGAVNPTAYTSWASAPGKVYRAKVRLNPNVTGPYRLMLAHYTAASALITTETSPAFNPPALAWTDLSHSFSNAAPAGTAITRLQIYREVASALATHIAYLDNVAVYDLAVPGADSLYYFDGSSSDPRYTFAWEGTASNSRSFAKANSTTGTVLVRDVDTASVAAYGTYPATIKLLTNWLAPLPMYAFAKTRALAERLSGGWQLPPARVDLLPLLDGRVSSITATPTATTPLELAGRLLRAELGSLRTIRYPGGVNPAHVPTIHAVTGPVTVLDETITPHRWVIETESERTT